MAYFGTKGWYIKQLKDAGIRHIDGKKLESVKTYVVRNLYIEKIEKAGKAAQ